MTFDTHLTVAIWYSILTIFFAGYAAFNIIQFRKTNDFGALYVAIIFLSLALGTACVAAVRYIGLDNPYSKWLFYMQRSSYMGVLLGGWWLIDYRVALRNGEGIPLRNLWRFWRLFCKGKNL